MFEGDKWIDLYFKQIWIIIRILMEAFNPEQCKKYVDKVFEDSLVQSLSDFIAIPNLSKAYDENWATNGLLEKAAEHIKTWVEGLEIKGLKSEIIKHEGLSPLLFTEIAGDIPDHTILFYGHLDKQPPMDGWDEGKGPTTPVIENNRLYGRGGADDGYSTYSSMLAVKAVQEQGIPIPRIVMITEADEESGGHIDIYMVALKERIGNPEVIFCLDSGAIDYDHMWLTSSLRGFIGGTLKVSVLTQAVHSGDASGVVPSAYRIANMLLARLEDVNTGQINKKFNVSIPPTRYKEAHDMVTALGDKSVKDYPFTEGTHAVSNDQLQLVLGRTWLPQLTVTGCDLPAIKDAGNVSRASVSFKLSLRCPPTLDCQTKYEELQQLLTSNPPYGAIVTFGEKQKEKRMVGEGWNCPEYSDWLDSALKESAQEYFGRELKGQGEGGSIPLMGLLSSLWPKAQFVVTGVLGPNSNAHGPNEFLDIPYCRKLTQAMAHVLALSSKEFAK